MSAPLKAFFMPSPFSGRYPSMVAMDEMWDKSAVTPRVLTTS
jgi:hypothetical protein